MNNNPDKVYQLAATHAGIMPIRVLQHNLIYDFENTYQGFKDLTIKIVEEAGLNRGIVYTIEEDRVKIPGVTVNKQIFVQEPFLSYVWCMSFSLAVLYDEFIAKTSQNHVAGKEIHHINKGIIERAYNLWQYGISLIGMYSPWDLAMPNPEEYFKEETFWIERANSLYLMAMKFILCHEFAHIELRHSERRDKGEERAKLENEADLRAIELLLEGANQETLTTTRFGILIGLCSLLFFNKETQNKNYPDIDHRIDNIIEKINPEEADGMWGIASLAYKLWDRQFLKMFSWPKEVLSHKELYYMIRKQISEEKQ